MRFAAATGRHFALVATKPMREVDGPTTDNKCVVVDRRQETAKVDTHLKTWEAKERKRD